MNSKVNDFIEKSPIWQKEIQVLRKILINCDLDEDLKWGKPCYSYRNNNIAIIQPFKEYFALLFFKGVLLNDSEQILVRTGENTHVGRQIRFSDSNEILEKEQIIKAYIFEAIEVEKSGLKVPVQKVTEYDVPEELLAKFNEIPSLKHSFQTLTPGRQKAYLIYFSQARQSKTRFARIEKYIPNIFNQKGLND